MPDALPYMAEPQFALLRQACNTATKAAVARQLGVSAATVGQVLNGSGAYGQGKASTRKLFIRVEALYGHWVCPHLTEQGDGSPQVITAEQCRRYAHRPVPTSSPRDIAHWQACRKCVHCALTQPPQPRPVVKRRQRATTATTAPAPDAPDHATTAQESAP